jgi:hypothetical protein
MHDHLGLGGRHRLGDRLGVESVGHDRVCSQAARQILLRCCPGHCDHVVALCHELGDELSADNACGAGYEDLYDCSSRLLCPLRRDSGAACDSASALRSQQAELGSDRLDAQFHEDLQLV